MNALYKLGVIIGIIAIYSLITWGLGAIITSDNYNSDAPAIGAWMIGMLAFVFLAIFTMEKFGLWMA